MACRLGDDVYEWRVEQLGEWLRNVSTKFDLS